MLRELFPAAYRHVARVAVASLALGLVACDDAKPRAPSVPPAGAAAASVSRASSNVAPAQSASVEHGRELVRKFECSRCHDGTGLAPAPLSQHCAHCHQDILAGKFKASAPKVEQWKTNVAWVRDIPSLEATGARFQPAWIERYLRAPHDLRPNLAQSMPRLKLSPSEARDIAAYLTRNRPSSAGVPVAATELAAGRELLDTKGCGGCHVFSGVPALSSTPSRDAPLELRRAASLAPDLRYTRERFRPEQLVHWIMDPKALKPDTLMAPAPLTAAEARALASYILYAPLTAEPKRTKPARLPLLTRRVTFEEVNGRVLSRTCRHCHSNPDSALGDGGPGNTGGFGFAPRGLNLASYSGVLAGAFDENQQRRSVFAKTSDGTPRLVAALLARQAEEAGEPNPEVTGMPLSLPSLSSEDIQLVDTWIAQGRPR